MMDILLGRMDKYDAKTIWLSFIGWESIGNSNWYMFLTFILYIFTLIGFSLFKKNNRNSIIFVTILTILYSVIILKYKPQWWMNTALCFPLGMFYSYYKENIERYLMNNIRYFITTIILIGVWAILTYIYMYKTSNAIIYSIISCVFSLIIVCITMKVSINNKILQFLGQNVFWMYILQRIPMIVFSKFGIEKYSYIFFILCFGVTVGLSYVYTNIFDKKLIKFIKNNRIQESIGGK